MKKIKYTLLADGSSDKTLMSIINWLLNDLIPTVAIEKQFADLRILPNPPSLKELDKRIEKAIELYPCDILFVHRDAEQNDNPEEIIRKRSEEIMIGFGRRHEKLVKVIPIRMMETWFLIDELSIRKAADNRNSTVKISLPNISKLESITNPKKDLHQLLKDVSQKKGRRLDNFNVNAAVHIVAESIENYSILRKLFAFQSFENDLKIALKELELY